MERRDMGGEPRAVPAWWADRDGWAFWDDYDAGRWERATHACIRNLVTPGSTFVDIGAWIGPVTLWAVPLAARVVAVEPDPVARACLVANTAACTNVTVVGDAVGPETGAGAFVAHREGFGSSMSRLAAGVQLDDVWDLDVTETVATVTVPDLFEREQVSDCSLVKLDIEGSEADILDSVCPFLVGLGVPLLVSMHEPWWSRSIEASWFEGFDLELFGEWGPFGTLLATPSKGRS